MPIQINIGGFAGVVSSLLSTVLTSIADFFRYIWNTLVAIFDFLFGLQAESNTFNFSLFGKVRAFFTNLWEKVIKAGLLRLYHWYRQFFDWLDRVIGPILRKLQWLINQIDKWYFKIFGPILNAIQTSRKILSIFRFFNLKWAKKLDERLYRLEKKILEPYLEIRAKINEIIQYIELITNADGILRASTTLRSIGAVFGALFGLISARFNRGLDPVEAAQQKRDRERYRAKAVVQHQNDLYKNGLSAEDRAEQDAARKALLETTGLQDSDLPAIE